jgi:prepilin-type N-terminal cleavage/methylation domain-containing protein
MRNQIIFFKDISSSTLRQVQDEASFTLIELLVVIGILGVLATAVVLVLNPAQLLAQARDSTRLSDLASLNQTLSLFQTDQYNRSLGTSSVVYVSVPDSSPTCLNLGLPTLPGGWSYSCAPASTLQKVDGSGWIPVPLNLISSGSPLSKLPIDPVNATSTGNYYTYTPGGSWELVALMESAKYIDREINDGGIDPAAYETGNNISLSPFARGLVGYWGFEGDVNDYSGFGNNGTWNGTSTTRYVLGKVGQAGSFNGSSDYVALPDNSVNSLVGGRSSASVTGWIKPGTVSGTHGIVWIGENVVRLYANGARGGTALRNNNSTLLQLEEAGGGSLVNGNWIFLAGVYNGASVTLYVNGSVLNSGSLAGNLRNSYGNDNYDFLGADAPWSTFVVSRFFNGLIDDVRVYNRALSAAEIQAIYNATR